MTSVNLWHWQDKGSKDKSEYGCISGKAGKKREEEEGRGNMSQ